MKHEYTQEDLDQAILAVSGGESLRKAALAWGIPRGTLQGRIHSRATRHQVKQET